MDKLLKQIEEARHNMHQLTGRYSLSAPQVVEQSQKLDGLLNTYYLVKASKAYEKFHLSANFYSWDKLSRRQA
ncbi:aspartyl-phosphate phosphatase Spo0E family protein [Paenibacillus sp. N4]|uniref:aspartyl-phosphate phosphatase Spo0E family protein n=1 Tax=Paenibacillus vietnamensis TaxID=2590547 RepID=UPI001CD0C86B|nr:aspartyl-phosphate phosphatase Spo0E family protein [Paenibacillus vietnamensis]MCA0757301.1 aspartyl-phosphate phosphatase Spo0E family protein [Paenibacillus vietnamensis]